jgi:hypothetical protein
MSTYILSLSNGLGGIGKRNYGEEVEVLGIKFGNL